MTTTKTTIAADVTGARIDTTDALRCVVKQHRQRRAAFWNITTGELISESGPGVTLSPNWSLTEVLNVIAEAPKAVRPRTLFLIGGESAETTPLRLWWAAPALHGWQYDGYEIAAHAATGGADARENAGEYTLGEGADQVAVTVKMSALWFPGVQSARDCRDYWNSLRQSLQRHFDPSATLLATPAMTGLDLLHRSLPRGVVYPLAPVELRELLYRISGQGRFEFCAWGPRIGQPVEGLFTLDARWMYAACVRGLPIGLPTRRAYTHGADADEAYVPYAPGWYLVDVQVPRDWRHLGLIAQTVNGEAAWPAEPGQWLRQVWTTGSELAVALKAGWPVIISERWVYEDGPQTHAPDPTRRWIETLRTLRERNAHMPPVAAALRHLMIDTVGMWHRQAGRKLRITPIAQYPGRASGAELHHIDQKRGLATWYEPKPLNKSALPWQRPEWSATTWGRARARVNEAALRIPRGDLVAYRSDALITCVEPQPQLWLDDGRPGTFRRKSDVWGPLALPGSIGDVLQLRRAAEEKDGEG